MTLSVLFRKAFLENKYEHHRSMIFESGNLNLETVALSLTKSKSPCPPAFSGAFNQTRQSSETPSTDKDFEMCLKALEMLWLITESQ